MPVYSIPFPSIMCLVLSLTLPERTSLKLCCLCFTHPAWVAALWECRDLTAVLKYEECAKTEGFPCEAVTSHSSAVTCSVVVNADTRSRAIPL